MCGINGQFNFHSRQPVDEAQIRQATSTLAHRGPDDEGFFFSGPVGLGFRRLSIIDLGGGHQPMSDDEGLIWLVFNGEIYNFRELRRELETYGHRFRTNSDTEVIIYGYKQWGDGVFDRLNGMFGLAIWDARQQRLVLARDAMGIKPVYYRVDSGTLFFGSEIRSVVNPTREATLDPVSLNLFLRYRFTPSPLTLFEGVRKIVPGGMLVAERGEIRATRWYCYKPQAFVQPKSLREAKSDLTALYRAALRRHLISDVPVGLLLSGGVDSSLLLALMHETGGTWPTYTVGYGREFADDELADAHRTARLFNTRHVSVELTTEMFERYLPIVVSSLEEPVAAASIVPMYAVCERARQDVKVVLIGQGPDELFGGYTRHLGVRYGGLWRKSPAFLRGALSPLLEAIPRCASIQRGLYALGVDDQFLRFRNVLSILPGNEVDSLFQDGLIEPDCGDTILDCWADLRSAVEDTDELGAFQYLEVRSTLPDELLVYADKLSMAHGLEARVPYLDREVVEYAQRLDARLKVSFGRRKRVHRAVCAEFLPTEVLRRKKRGFAGNVVDEWFSRSVSREMESLLLDSYSMMYRFLKPAAVMELLRSHQHRTRDNHKILFSLVVLEWWLRSARDRHGTCRAAATP